VQKKWNASKGVSGETWLAASKEFLLVSSPNSGFSTA
jgi:hypothetical protein